MSVIGAAKSAADSKAATNLLELFQQAVDAISIMNDVKENTVGNKPAGTTNEVDFCFWTSSPDQLSDYDHSNHSLCGTYTVTVFAGDMELDEENSFSIHPNPSGNYLCIEGKLTADIKFVSLSVYDVAGRRIPVAEDRRNNKTTLDVSKLSAGIYTLNIRANNNVIVRKFVKQ